MKQFYLVVLFVISYNLAFSAPVIKATQNGNWQATSTWDQQRKPQNNDSIVIPTGKTVTINLSQTLNNVKITVQGTVRFANLFTYLSVNASSSINIVQGGKIEATLDFLQYLIFGGQTIFYAQQISGPAYVSSSTNGFAGYDPLPVKFVGFTASRKNTSDVLLQWSTSIEENARMYEVERSFDGSEWSTIAYVSAVGNSRDVNNYSYTDKNIPAKTAYYRVKQVDADNRFSFTDIKMVKFETKTAAAINIASVQGKVLLQFPKEIEGNMIVRFVSLGGQVMDQQTISQPFGQIVLQTKSNIRGNYIVSVSNGKDVNIAKQVIL
jgi:hypothetical protein